MEDNNILENVEETNEEVENPTNELNALKSEIDGLKKELEQLVKTNSDLLEVNKELTKKLPVQQPKNEEITKDPFLEILDRMQGGNYGK